MSRAAETDPAAFWISSRLWYWVLCHLGTVRGTIEGSRVFNMGLDPVKVEDFSALAFQVHLLPVRTAVKGAGKRNPRSKPLFPRSSNGKPVISGPTW
jgi:hypothetical protein